jgi:iron complex transport system substrate-binding protein
VSPREVQKALDQWKGKKPSVVSLEAMNLEGLWKDILNVGQAVGLKEEALTLVHRLQGRLKTVNDRIQSVTRQPSLVCLEWFSPLMFGGNWIPELVELAGGKNVVGRAGEHSGWMSWEDLLKADPDFLALIPCGMDLKRTEQEAKILSENPIWRKLKAVQSGHVFAVDANQYFNRPGPRLVDSCEILAEMLYPDLFSQEYQGKAFKPFQS